MPGASNVMFNCMLLVKGCQAVMHTTSIKETIANRPLDKTFKPIANSQLVDQLLKDCSDLIDQAYLKWFAKRFYTLNPEQVQRCASEARADASQSPKKLFTFLIKKASAK